MSYTTSYKDENGCTKDVTISDSDCVMALSNDYRELIRTYDPRRVSITRIQAAEGEALHLKVTVHAPTHYLTGPHDHTPKPAQSMSFDIIAYPGYPLKAVRAYYDPARYLASPNVFRSGAACIDEWRIFTSSLLTVCDKLVRDVIHDPNVTLYSSMANAYMEDWHRKGAAAKRFPTIPTKLLYAPDAPPLPRRSSTGSKPVSATPPLPGGR